MNDQLRALFEAAVIERMKESGFLEVEIRVEMLGRQNTGYSDPSTDAYWHFFQRGAASVVVDLPALSAKALHVENNVGTGLVRYDEACAAVEDAGGTVKS